MMGGWVAIILDRKLRIAHFEFACTMLWLVRQRALVHVPLPVWYAIDRHTQTFREVNGINAKTRFLAQTKGRREKEREKEGKEKGKLEVKLWQKRKKSQTPQPGIEPGTPANGWASAAFAGVPGSIPGWGICDFSVSAKASLPISLSLSPFPPFPFPSPFDVSGSATHTHGWLPVEMWILIGAGLRCGFQDDVALSGNGN